MEIKITFFINLLLYALVVSQSLFYILALSYASKTMQAGTYIESRKLIDAKLRNNLTLVYYLALASSIALTSFTIVNPSGALFMCSLVALGALILDIALALHGNIPLNHQISNWDENAYPENWKHIRNKWFRYYTTRQVANITGFITLIAGYIFGT